MTEFTIHGVVCQVLPEEHLTESLEAEAGGQASFHIVGNCRLNGQRYVLVCQRKADGALEDETPLASDLLTRRELQVAMMVCQGRGNKQIAHRLHLSEWTVSTYLRRIFAKLGVRTRSAMVAKIVADNIVSMPADMHTTN